MSGFHPVLGLLAVAVCISFVKAAVIPLIPKHDASANKLQESNSDRLLVPRRYDNVQAGALHKNEKTPLREYENGQNADIITGRNAAYNNGAGVFGQVKNLERAGEDDLRAQAIRTDSASGTLDENSGQDGLITGGGGSKSEASSSMSSEESQSDGGTSDGSDFGSKISKSEEQCEDDEETENSTVGTSTATTSSRTSEPASNPDTSGSGSGTSSESSAPEEPVEDSTQNPRTEECDPDEETTSPSTDGGDETTSTPSEEGQDCEGSGEVTDAVTTTTTRTTTTTTTKKPKKPDDDNRSSRSFWDSDSQGLQSSESKSIESEGDSTNFSSGR